MFWCVVLCVSFQFSVLGSQIYNETELKRIVGGHTTDIKKFPYQVMVRCIKDQEMTICGGALLSKNKIATAAHCVTNCDENHLQILAGTQDFDSELKHKVRSIHSHPDYDEENYLNDVAIVCLEYNLQMGDRIKQIKVAQKRVKPGTRAVVTGWGKTGKELVSRKLRFAKVTVIDNDECQRENPMFDSREVCTDSDGIGPCQGDSGGPLVANGELIGIVGYGSKNCAEEFVRVYADAVHFKKFLESTKC